MMAFINPSLKRDAFDDLVRSFDSESVNRGTRGKMVVVFDYFKNIWINGKIDVTLWYFTGCEMRTNNICEPFHSGFTAAFPNLKHPQLFNLAMMVLDYEQAQNSLLKSVTETDFMPRVKKYQHHVNKVLSDVSAKYEMKLIPSMKAYLMF